MNEQDKLDESDYIDELVEMLEPARRFRENDYPCPHCGEQLPIYGQGIHICPSNK